MKSIRSSFKKKR